MFSYLLISYVSLPRPCLHLHSKSEMKPSVASAAFLIGTCLAAVGFTPGHANAWAGPRPAVDRTIPQLVHKIDVIGDDEREPIPQELERVADSIGLLWQRGGGSVCTAFCVGDSTIATNGHCIVNRGGHRLGQLDQFQFMRAPLSERMRPNDHITGLALADRNSPRLSFYAGYFRGPTTEHTMIHDWAFAKLSRPVCRGHRLELEVLKPDQLLRASRDGRIVMIGYHGDRGLESRWLSPCEVEIRTSALFLTHTCDSFKGSSGSPLLLLREGNPTVVGINVGSVATRRYRVRTDRYTHQRIGRPTLLSTSVINVAVGAAAFRDGLDVFDASTLLRNLAEFKEYQQLLGQLGLYNGSVDGQYGPMTRAGTIALERLTSREPIGLPTQELLNEARKRVASSGAAEVQN